MESRSPLRYQSSSRIESRSYKLPIVHSPRETSSAADFHYPAPLSNANTMGTAVRSIQEAVANVTQYS